MNFQGYGTPRTVRGIASAYGPPPWHMNGRVFTVWYRLENPDEARKHIPPPLEIPADPLCRARFYDVIHDAGKGDDYAALNPEQTRFHEAVIAIEASYGELHGDYSIHIYADDPTYIAWGREVYGWHLKMGKISMSRPWHPANLQPGVHITGSLERFGTRLISAEVRLTEVMPPSERPQGLPNWFNYKIIPSVDKPEPEVHQLIVAGPSRVEAPVIWKAEGKLAVGAGINDEVEYLRPREIVAADYIPYADLTVGYGRVLARL